MPWKNGAGTTIEIAVFPAQVGLDDFVWRVSRAQVVANGGFSHFAGIDRSLALLQGAGMRLDIGGVNHQVDLHHNIVTFAGDVSLHAELISGPISDFNLMSRRSACHHQLNHWIGPAMRSLSVDTVLLYCAQGSGTLITEKSVCNVNADEAVQFAEDDNLAECQLKSSDDSRFYCVQIHG